jgi:hypothetical protein
MTSTLLLPAPQTHNYNKVVFACINALMNSGCILTGHSPVLSENDKKHLLIGQNNNSYFTYTDYVKIQIKMPKNGGDITINISTYQHVALLTFTHVFLLYKIKRKIKKLVNNNAELEKLYNTQKFIPTTN